MLACTQPARRASGRRTTNTGGRARIAGSNSGSSEYEVAAHQIDRVAAAAVAEQRDVVPGQRVEQSRIGTRLSGRGAADRVAVAVGQHDHVACVGPVALAVVARDPARAAGDDVEQDQPLGARVQRIGQRQRRRLERERLGELGAEEDRALEPQAARARRRAAPVRTVDAPGRDAVSRQALVVVRSWSPVRSRGYSTRR